MVCAGMLTREEIKRLVAANTPIMYMHPADKFMPCSAEWFMERSCLEGAVPVVNGEVPSSPVGVSLLAALFHDSNCRITCQWWHHGQGTAQAPNRGMILGSQTGLLGHLCWQKDTLTCVIVCIHSNRNLSRNPALARQPSGNHQRAFAVPQQSAKLTKRTRMGSNAVSVCTLASTLCMALLLMQTIHIA